MYLKGSGATGHNTRDIITSPTLVDGFDEAIVQDDEDLPPSHWVMGDFESEGEDLADTEPTYNPDTGMPIPDGIEPAGPSDTFSFRGEARRWSLPKTRNGTALYANRD